MKTKMKTTKPSHRETKRIANKITGGEGKKKPETNARSLKQRKEKERVWVETHDATSL